MDSGSIAILISIASACIAAFSLGWNIYRDVILKARLKVTFSIKNIYMKGAPPGPDYIGISATNHGPGPVILNTIALRDSSLTKKLRKKERFAALNHDYENPLSSKLPLKLEMGETADYFVNFDEECFAQNEFTQLGITDSFGRTHWAPKKSMSHLRKRYSKEFGNET